MTNELAHDYMENEIRCVQRASNGICTRNCSECDLVREDQPLLEAYGLAVLALEKQIPKKPIQGEPFWWIDTVKVRGRNKDVKKKSYGYTCPCCSKSVAKLSNEFCNHCGQAIDWSD